MFVTLTVVLCWYDVTFYTFTTLVICSLCIIYMYSTQTVKVGLCRSFTSHKKMLKLKASAFFVVVFTKLNNSVCRSVKNS